MENEGRVFPKWKEEKIFKNKRDALCSPHTAGLVEICTPVGQLPRATHVIQNMLTDTLQTHTCTTHTPINTLILTLSYLHKHIHTLLITSHIRTHTSTVTHIHTFTYPHKVHSHPLTYIHTNTNTYSYSHIHTILFFSSVLYPLPGMNENGDWVLLLGVIVSPLLSSPCPISFPIFLSHNSPVTWLKLSGSTAFSLTQQEQWFLRVAWPYAQKCWLEVSGVWLAISGYSHRYYLLCHISMKIEVAYRAYPLFPHFGKVSPISWEHTGSESWLIGNFLVSVYSQTREHY